MLREIFDLAFLHVKGLPHGQPCAHRIRVADLDHPNIHGHATRTTTYSTLRPQAVNSSALESTNLRQTTSSVQPLMARGMYPAVPRTYSPIRVSLNRSDIYYHRDVLRPELLIAFGSIRLSATRAILGRLYLHRYPQWPWLFTADWTPPVNDISLHIRHGIWETRRLARCPRYSSAMAAKKRSRAGSYGLVYTGSNFFRGKKSC